MVTITRAAVVTAAVRVAVDTTTTRVRPSANQSNGLGLTVQVI